MYGGANKEIMQELEQSLVGETLKPIEFEDIKRKLWEAYPSIESTRKMGEYKLLITFHFIEDKEMAMKKGGKVLQMYLDEIRNWTTKETSQTRRLWVKCFGVPLHAWSKANFKKIKVHVGL